ncbi:MULTISPECIES: cell envelope integrity TolA C-terminal domain-containing protein [unclassified Erwinia]|uniref:cell envelope integrity TolA C-terminal domain-containing protein n=1 Tax=unclassified Erwinia TaxID=2622719 RepID=UPI0009EE1BF8|nr:cell envelope integrity TolA C-terminal domain-containing protein [Erwinia sp. ErVv1]
MASNGNRSALIAAGMAGMLLLLAGCQSAPKDRSSLADWQAQGKKICATRSSIPQDACVYSYIMREGIQSEFPEAARYKGRQCTLEVEYGKNHRYSVLSTAGDEALCLKAWSLVSSNGNLPPPPPALSGKNIVTIAPR